MEPLYRPSLLGFAVDAGSTVRLTAMGVPTGFRSLAAASTIDLAQDYLDAHPAIEWPDGLNRPGAYRIRQLAGIRRLFGDSVDDNTILSAGTLRPPVYMEADNSPGLLKQREEVERWKLQNESAVMTMVWRTAAPYTDVAHAFVTPLQLLTLARHHRPPGSAGPVWQVNHAWDDVGGYRQTIRASLWQGDFFRTTGADVTAGSL